MALDINELKQKRAQIVAEMRALNDGMVDRGEETAEETEKFAKMEGDIRSLEKIIEREELLAQKEADLAKVEHERQRNGGGANGGSRWEPFRYPVIESRQRTRANIERQANYFIQGWLRSMKPDAKIEHEHTEAAKFFGFSLQHREIEIPLVKDYRQIKKEYRDMSLTVGSGGYTVPEGFVNALEQALLQFGGVRQVADVMRTDSGADLPWPTMNDTGNKGAILAEATTFGTSVDPTFASVVFKAFKYSSKPIIVSNELLQDSAFDLGAMIGGWLGTRIGRIQNDHFTTGAGTTLPKGIVVSSTEGAAAASETAIVDTEIIDLEHSVDPAYRPGAQWMFHDAVLAAIRKLKDSTTGQYLWQPGMQAGVPDRLLGYTYVVNQSMASALAKAAKVVLFGDFSKYKIRDVAGIRLVRLDELFAQTDQVGFVAFLRSDGQLLDAGTNPVKHLTCKK
jgi:HK97 family phage major capsid protein